MFDSKFSLNSTATVCTILILFICNKSWAQDPPPPYLGEIEVNVPGTTLQMTLTAVGPVFGSRWFGHQITHSFDHFTLPTGGIPFIDRNGASPLDSNGFAYGKYKITFEGYLNP